MASDLYSYQEPQGYGGAKRMVPSTKGGYVDIVRDYPWTASPPGIRNAIPFIELEEFRQNFSSELISLVQNLAGNAQNILLSGPGNTTNDAIQELLIGKAITGTAAGAAAGAARQAGRLAGGVPVVGAFLQGVVEQASRITTTGIGVARVLRNQAVAYGVAANSLENINKSIDPSMDPYSRLYSATPTGFKYKLPFINIDNFTEAGGGWSPANEKSLVQKGLESVKTLLVREAKADTDAGKLAAGYQTGYDIIDALEGISKGLVGAAPGVAAETLKSFTPKADGESIKIVFYLSNTLGMDPATIKRNWELLYLLTYQNLPNRRSINLLDPPCLYKVTIPGLKTYPVAIIESLKITNEGTLRRIDLDTGDIAFNQQTGPSIKVVPEVYKITLTIKSLLTSTQNIFYYGQANDEKVNVITSSYSAPDALKQATKGSVSSIYEALTPNAVRGFLDSSLNPGENIPPYLQRNNPNPFAPPGSRL